VTPLVRRVTWHNRFVPLAGANLVIATGTAVALHGFVRLDVPDVDAVVVFSPAVHPRNANA
jgi:hypothetical protein